MRNGRRVSMRIGNVRIFAQGDWTCRLVLHVIAEDYAGDILLYLPIGLSPLPILHPHLE